MRDVDYETIFSQRMRHLYKRRKDVNVLLSCFCPAFVAGFRLRHISRGALRKNYTSNRSHLSQRGQQVCLGARKGPPLSIFNVQKPNTISSDENAVPQLFLLGPFGLSTPHNDPRSPSRLTKIAHSISRRQLQCRRRQIVVPAWKLGAEDCGSLQELLLAFIARCL